MKTKRLLIAIPFMGMLAASCSLQPHDLQQQQTRARALDLVEQGQKFENQGQFEPAIQRYLQARELHETPQVDYRLGHSYAQINDLATARQYLKKAVEGSPANSAAFFELVHVEEQIKNGGATVAPSSAPAIAQARPTQQSPAAQMPTGQSAPTIAPLSTATPVASVPATQPAPSGKGSVKLSDAYRVLFNPNDGEHSRSVPVGEAGSTFLADASFHASKGREYLKNGKPDLAIEELKDALARNPNDGASRVLLSQAYQKMGDKAEAQRQLTMALKNDPSNSGALVALSEMNISGGKNNVQAQQLLEQMSASGSNDMDTQIALGDLYVKMGRQQSAADAYQKAHQIKPADPRPLWKLGNVRRSANDVSGARQYYQEALRNDPRFIPALNNLAALADEAGEYDNARMYLEQIIQIDPNWAKAYFNLGVLYEQRLKNPARAAEYYNQYLRIGGPLAEQARANLAALRAKP